MHTRSSAWLLVTTGISGFIAVSLGALGAHALRDTLQANATLDAWQTAASYQLAHTLAALVALVWALHQPALARRLRSIATLWLVGCVLFSGSIYALALGGPRMLGPVTPLGGLSFLAGWAGLIWLAFSLKPTAPATR